MAKTKSKDEIRLSDGRVMTLGDALDEGLVRVKKTVRVSRKRDGLRREITAWVAEETFGEDPGYFEIGERLYKSRVSAQVGMPDDEPASFRGESEGLPRVMDRIYALPVTGDEYADEESFLSAVEILADYQVRSGFGLDLGQSLFAATSTGGVSEAYQHVAKMFDVDTESLVESVSEVHLGSRHSNASSSPTRRGLRPRTMNHLPNDAMPPKRNRKLEWVTQGRERIARGPRGTYRITGQRGSYRVELVRNGKSKDVSYGSLSDVKAWAHDHAFPRPEVQAILNAHPEEISEEQLQVLMREAKEIDEEDIAGADEEVYADWQARRHLVDQKIEAILDVARDMGASHYDMAVDQRDSEDDIDDYRENLADTAYNLWGRGVLFNAATDSFDEAEEYGEAQGFMSKNPAGNRNIMPKSHLSWDKSTHPGVHMAASVEEGEYIIKLAKLSRSHGHQPPKGKRYEVHFVPRGKGMSSAIRIDSIGQTGPESWEDVGILSQTKEWAQKHYAGQARPNTPLGTADIRKIKSRVMRS